MLGDRVDELRAPAASGPGRGPSMWTTCSPPKKPKPPPNAPPPTAVGHNRMARPSRQSSSLGAARGFWSRAWGRHEPAGRETGRLDGPARWQDSPKGGLDIPANHAECDSHR